TPLSDQSLLTRSLIQYLFPEATDLPTDCCPSGAIFQKPLVLEFIVGDGEDLKGSKVTGEEREEHLADLQDTYKVFWSAEEGARWKRLDGGAVVLDKTLRKLFYQVHVDHFSRGYLG
ncbi:unnamed protein product, partial [Ectocarpus sp. 12 AP-2014]